MQFKDKVQEVRGRLLLSQEDLAKELGVSFATVNRWENGRNEPNFLTQRRFRDYCEKKSIKFEE